MQAYILWTNYMGYLWMSIGAAVVVVVVVLAVSGASEDEPDRPRSAPPPQATETAPGTSGSAAGPAERRPADTVRVAGGNYPLGTESGPDDERPAHSVSLRAFRIDRFEVTNADYARFLNSLGVRPTGDAEAGGVGAETFEAADAARFIEGAEGEEQSPLIALDDEHARIAVEDGRFVPVSRWADHPVTEVTWRGADRYARWVGGRLPTEAEWEAAARGREGRAYPWGDEPPTPERAVYGRASGETVAAGSRPAGATPLGLHDLAGNVDEWTSSLYRPYPYRASDGREGRATGAEEYVTRGGNHVYSSAEELRSAYRAGFSREPDRGHRHIGFRVAYPAARWK